MRRCVAFSWVQWRSQLQGSLEALGPGRPAPARPLKGGPGGGGPLNLRALGALWSTAGELTPDESHRIHTAFQVL